jgi:hypothetical protein
VGGGSSVQAHRTINDCFDQHQSNVKAGVHVLNLTQAPASPHMRGRGPAGPQPRSGLLGACRRTARWRWWHWGGSGRRLRSGGTAGCGVGSCLW